MERKSWCARQNPEALKRKKPQDHGWGEFLQQMWKARTKKEKIGIQLHYDFGFLSIGTHHTTAKGKAHTGGAQNPPNRGGGQAAASGWAVTRPHARC